MEDSNQGFKFQQDRGIPAYSCEKMGPGSGLQNLSTWGEKKKEERKEGRKDDEKEKMNRKKKEKKNGRKR